MSKRAWGSLLPNAEMNGRDALRVLHERMIVVFASLEEWRVVFEVVARQKKGRCLLDVTIRASQDYDAQRDGPEYWLTDDLDMDLSSETTEVVVRYV